MTFKNRNLVFGHLMLEFFLLNICVLIAATLFSPVSVSLDNNLTSPWLLFIIFNLGWGVIVLTTYDKDFIRKSGLKKRFKHMILNSFILVGICFTLGTIFQIDYFTKPTGFIVPIFSFLVINLLLFNSLFEFYKRRNLQSISPKILVVGTGKNWGSTKDFTQKVESNGYDIIGFIGKKIVEQSSNKIEGQIHDISNIIEQNTVDEIFVSVSDLEERDIKHVIDAADYHGVRVNIIPDIPSIVGKDIESSSIDELPLLKVHSTPLDDFNNYIIKKTFDFCFALGVLVFLSPLFLLIGLLIYLDSKGPIFYKPLRKGEAGKDVQMF